MCDDFVKNILILWGFEDLCKSFADADIDEEAFRLLDEESYKTLIPSLGKLLKFKKKYENFMKEESKEKETGFKASTPNSSDSTVTYHSGEITPINFDLTFLNPTDEQCQNIEPENGDQNINKCTDQTFSSKEEQLYTCETSKRSIFPNGLRGLLLTTIEGKQLLNRKHLDEKCRKALTKIIIEYLLNESGTGRISTQTFSQVSEEIVRNFPTENAKTYFIPYKQKTKTSPKILSKGKLWSRYINYRKRSLSENRVQGISQDDDDDTIIPEEPKDIEKHMNILKHTTELTSETRNSFHVTYFKRKDELNTKDPHEYLDLFPILKTCNGYKFLLDDFNREYPEKENILFEKWPILAEKILKLAEKRNLQIERETNDTIILSIKILPHLFEPYTVRTSKGKCFRPSKLEMQNSFLLHVQTPGEIQVKIESREEKLVEGGLTLQPFIIIVGQLNDIQTCYVAVNKIFYNIPSPLAALDVCFKIFFALKTHFPSECKHVWTYIQQEIYNIKSDWDIDYPSVATLSKELQISD